MLGGLCGSIGEGNGGIRECGEIEGTYTPQIPTVARNTTLPRRSPRNMRFQRSAYCSSSRHDCHRNGGSEPMAHLVESLPCFPAPFPEKKETLDAMHIPAALARDNEPMARSKGLVVPIDFKGMDSQRQNR